ncbi:hypothetical protein [Paracoccus niistensis]|uniref:DUF2946 domain-containing protein n=1 Tax=Paracoccus niistensis TaxID=632935 RepID=A0ABV6HZY9_9RHOB
MTAAVLTHAGSAGGTVQPIRTLGPWVGIGRLFACFALALVLALVISPGEARAHGLHGSPAPVAQTVETSSVAQATSSGAEKIPASDCMTCCTSSGCLVTNLAAHDLDPADQPPGVYRAASVMVVYQTPPHGLLRPPRHAA